MVDDPKEVEFYAASLNAWFNTRFEHDKSLLTLSAGGVGLLITLISTVGVKSIESLVLYIFALLCFIFCLGSLLWIFRRNAIYLEKIVKNNATNDPILNILDRTAVLTFMLGVVFSSIIGISTAVNAYVEKEIIMTKNKDSNSQITSINESVNDISNMRPSKNEKMSVEGIVNMKPESTPQKPQAPTSDSKEK